VGTKKRLSKKNIERLEENVDMKAHRLFPIAALLFWVTLAYVAGCKYDVTEPLWNQPYTPPATPQITSVDPASEARPGVSTISIHGTNLVVQSAVPGVSNASVVQFGGTSAEIVTSDANLIVVRRPNMVSDSCVIRVSPHNAIETAVHGPYKVYPVLEKYGSFLQNIPLAGIAVDNAENLFVIEVGNKTIHMVTPNGDNTVLAGGNAKTAFTPFGARIGPDGNLYVTENNRSIDKVDLTTGAVARWTQLPSGKVVKFGDFGPGGYFYTGGPRTDLCIIPPNPANPLALAQMKLAGPYITDEILAIRVSNGYVYVASRTFGTTSPAKIWRNLITADSVGSQELVLDMGTTAYGSDLVTDMAFSATGTMFIGMSSAENPLLIVNLATMQVDNFYKGIVPGYCGGFSWSKSSNYLYAICGNTAAAETWTVYRVDMGSAGAP
jgi:hypothetical protein